MKNKLAFLWHLLLQNLKTLASLRTNVIPMYCHHDSSKLIENITNPWKGSKAASRSSTSLSYVGVSEDYLETYAQNKPHDDRKILSCTFSKNFNIW